MTLDQLKDKYLTPDNARQYWQTRDKYLFVEYLTDLPNNSKLLDQLDEAFWLYCEAEQSEADRFDYTNKIDR